jgi:hypothetical protein
MVIEQVTLCAVYETYDGGTCLGRVQDDHWQAIDSCSIFL